jgi:hypothetical protein
VSYALAQKIRQYRIYSIKEFTEKMRADGFGRWSDTEVPAARAYYDKLCNVVSWADLEHALRPAGRRQQERPDEASRAPRPRSQHC